MNEEFQSHVFTSCCGSGRPPPGNCQGRGPWCWETWCRSGTTCPPPGRFGACGTDRVSSNSSQKSPSLHQHAPSRACRAASAERNMITESLLMLLCQRRALNGCCWAPSFNSANVISLIKAQAEAEWTLKHSLDVRGCWLMLGASDWTVFPWEELYPSLTSTKPCWED